MDRRHIVLIGMVATFVVGCRGSSAPPFPKWADSFSPNYDRSPNNAFDGYVSAALKAETDAEPYLLRVYFTPGKRAEALQRLGPALQILTDAASSHCEFRFSPSKPFEPAKYQKGWRMLGRALVWKIQDAVTLQDYSAAARETVLATKFGFDISGGGASDASLGLAIVDDARKAIAPSLAALSASDLLTLQSGVASALQGRPPVTNVIRNEHENMLLGVEAVQDAYRDNRYDELSKQLGPDARAAIEKLRDLHGKDDTDRPKYFDGFAGEGSTEVNYLNQVAILPAAQRSEVPEPSLKGERPWKRFAKSFFMTLRPLLGQEDATLARTRLLVLEAIIQQEIKRTGSGPKSLGEIDKDLRTDPYSGHDFVYRADGADHKIYSVGPNLSDEGGSTDDSYSEPDLMLESGG